MKRIFTNMNDLNERIPSGSAAGRRGGHDAEAAVCRDAEDYKRHPSCRIANAAGRTGKQYIYVVGRRGKACLALTLAVCRNFVSADVNISIYNAKNKQYI